MAKKKVSPELIESIFELPLKEKHKLLIRLINKDELLVEQLQYRLLENTDSDLQARIEDIKEEINKYFKNLPPKTHKQLIGNTKRMVMEINRFFKITKDKKGELELLLHLFKVSNKSHSNCRNILKDWIFKDKYKEYTKSKIKKMKEILDNIHEDYKIEYQGDLENIESFIEKV